jgi:hypothetical protein
MKYKVTFIYDNQNGFGRPTEGEEIEAIKKYLNDKLNEGEYFNIHEVVNVEPLTLD